MNWEQLRAILWLRWRLTRNQFTRGGQLNAVLSVLIGALLLMGSGVLGIVSIFVGALVVAKAPAPVLLLIWDGVLFAFLIFWLSGLMVEIQRSESIDIPKLLHLPVTLPQVFVFNYAVSHLTPALVLMLPGMIGLCLGLIAGAGLIFAPLLGVLLSLLFLITAWTYCLRGWLAALMVNKRRRRAIIVWLTLVLVLVGQLPNLLVHSRLFQKHERRPPSAVQAGGKKAGPPASPDGLVLPETFLEAHLIVAPGWVGYCAMELKERRMTTALAATAAACLLGALGLLRAYRLTLNFYRGAEVGGKAKPGQRASRPAGPSWLLEQTLPGLPDDTSGLALATFRSLVRAPEMKMAAVMPIVFLVLGLSISFAAPKGRLPGHLTDFAATGAIVLAGFSLGPTMSNMFGLDRNGFRSLVLLPTRRHHILLAKNLAFLPFAAMTGLLLLAVAAWVARLSFSAVATGLVQLPTCFVLFCVFCNLCAILAPYRFAPGTLQAKKPKPIVFLAVVCVMLMVPMVSPLILIPPGLELLFASLGWVPWLPVNFLSALVILAGVVALYAALLPFQGQLLQKREQKILSEVTEEVE
jgi:hypothetical protein